MVIENNDIIKHLYQGQLIPVKLHRIIYICGIITAVLLLLLSLILWYPEIHVLQVISLLLICLLVFTIYYVAFCPISIRKIIWFHHRQYSQYTTQALQQAIDHDQVQLSQIHRILILPAHLQPDGNLNWDKFKIEVFMPQQLKELFTVFIETDQGIAVYQLNAQGELLDQNLSDHYFSEFNRVGTIVFNYSYAIKNCEIVFNHSNLYDKLLEKSFVKKLATGSDQHD